MPMHLPSWRKSDALSSATSAVVESLENRRLLSSSPIYTEEALVPSATSSAALQNVANAIQNDELKEVALNLGGIFYYSSFWPFADALKMESRGWMVGRATDNNNTSVMTAAGDESKVDAQGYVIAPGIYNAKPFQTSSNPLGAPSGLYTVTWEGDGLVRLFANSNATTEAQLVESEPGRRVYRVTGGRVRIQVDNIATDGNYVRDVHVWMPDWSPADPNAGNLRSLEPTEEKTHFWHPQYLAHLREISDQVGYLRFMDWLETNANPQINWEDRRPPDYAFANGERSYKLKIAPGSTDGNFDKIGIAWEWVISLANELNLSPWINLPHAATDDYITKVAELFAGRGDSPGLNPGLKLYVEHSNEVWSSGNSFPQGNWSATMSAAAGMSKAEFNARRAVEVFRIFRQQFAQSVQTNPDTQEQLVVDRDGDIIAVAAGFTDSYTSTYLAAMAARADDWVALGEPVYGGNVVARTTYFGNNDFVRYLFNETDWLNVNLDDPNDPVIHKAMDAWITEFSLTANNFDSPARTQAEQYGMKYLAYEGGPSLYTNGVTVYIRDGKIVDASTPGATRHTSLSDVVIQNFPDDDGIAGNADRFTKYLMALNRHPRMADVYQAQLQVFKARGLKTHAAFTDIGTWNRNGQWGHKEYLGQIVGNNYGDAVKWNFLLNYAAEESAIRDVDEPMGAVPVLPENALLGSLFAGDNFEHNITALSLGDFSDLSQIQWDLVAGYLPEGVSLQLSEDRQTMNISGAPVKAGTYKLMFRVLDEDRDPGYGIYTIKVLAPPGVTSQHAAVADTFGSRGGTSTQTNSGGFAAVYVGGGQRTGYFKFDVRNLIAGEIDSAQFRFYVRGFEDSPNNPAVPTGGYVTPYKTSDYLKPLTPDETPVPWTESNLSSLRSPDLGESLGESKVFGANPAGWVTIDVTEYVRNGIGEDGFISIALTGTVLNGDSPSSAVLVASKEYSSSFAPQLIISQSPNDGITPLRADVQPITPNPRTAPLPSVEPTTPSAVVVFNKPVVGFDPSDVILKKNGATLSLSGVTVWSPDGGTTYNIYGLRNPTQTTGEYSLSIKVDGSGIASAADPADVLIASDTETWNMAGSTNIAGRYVFYNNSYFDGSTPGASPLDDAAIAPSPTDAGVPAEAGKTALRPGQGKATFANYTSYSKGINGVMIDLANLPFGQLTASDLEFKVGNAATPATMTPLTTLPQITIRPNAGVDGSDRITLIWPDGLIKNTWLQITVKATENTGLSAADVFYFGNIIGETGNAVGNTTVDLLDMNGARDNTTGRGVIAPAYHRFDVNRDSKVDLLDMNVVRDNNSGRTPVQLIVV